MPNPYLSQCWNIINWTPRSKLHWNCNRNSCIFIKKKMHLKMSSAKRQPFYLGLSALRAYVSNKGVCIMIVSILTMQMLLIVTQHHYIVLVLCRHLPQCLTHCGLMMPYGDIDTWSVLAQVMACCLTAPSHYLNQCWQLSSEVLWNSPKGKFTVSVQVVILYTCNEFENYTF